MFRAKWLKIQKRACSTYVQGQSPSPKIREYFYYVDHQGMLFLDDARIKNFTSCYKDKDFLVFFHKQMRRNNTGRYMARFPFLSLCGRERNFIRCDDTPTVYTHLIESSRLLFGNAGDKLWANMAVEHLYMNPTSGRVYHPAEERFGSFALIRSDLSMQLSSAFRFDNGEHRPPTHIVYNGQLIQLTQMLHDLVTNRDFNTHLQSHTKT